MAAPPQVWDVARPAIALHSISGHKDVCSGFDFLHPAAVARGPPTEGLISVSKDQTILRHDLQRQVCRGLSHPLPSSSATRRRAAMLTTCHAPQHATIEPIRARASPRAQALSYENATPVTTPLHARYRRSPTRM